jgi:hypothetical protein
MVSQRWFCDSVTPEMLLLGVHVEFDFSAGLFDIHAHFVCKIVLEEHQEDARRRLMTAFSWTHTPDDRLRSSPGFANYATRTYKLARVARQSGHQPAARR